MTTFPEGTGTDETNLLHRRMIVLGLDVDAWLSMEPAMLADLDESCSACASRGQCAYDLAIHLEEPTWPDWRDYCPNTARLRMLVALQGFMKKEAHNRTGDRTVGRSSTDSADGTD
jgi:hypothetical protein